MSAVADALDTTLAADELAGRHEWWRGQVADQAPSEQLSAGSSTGLAELSVRGIEPKELGGTPFDEPRADASRFLVELARTGEVDQESAGAELLIPPITDRWADAFASLADGWWSRLMTAVRAHAAGDLVVAERAYADSRSRRPTAWAARGLALLADAGGRDAVAGELYVEAAELAPHCLPLLVEATGCLVESGRPSAALELIERAPRAIAAHGRVQLQRCRALLAAGRPDEARTVLENGFEVPDLREGETLEVVWDQAFPERPLPAHYEFRMNPPPTPHNLVRWQ